MATSDQDQVMVGSWKVDATRNVISQGDVVRRLEPRVMQLLMRLVEGNGDVVSHDELLADVWNGRVVGDEALFRAVSELRRAMDTDSTSGSAIETIRGRGYSLTLSVKPVDIGGAGRLPARFVLIGGVLLIVAAALLLLNRPSNPPASPLPLTTFPEREIDPALSPDGQRVAFAWNVSGDYEIYVKNIDSGQVRRLTHRRGFEGHMAWSPDGRRIAYVAEDSSGTSLQTVDVATGESIVVAELDSWSFGLDWSSDSHTLVLSQPTNDAAMSIVFVDLNTGEIAENQWQDDVKHGFKPVFSSDGKKVAFIEDVHSGYSRVWVADIDQGSAQPATTSPMLFRGLDWIPGSEELVVSASLGAGYQLYRLSLDEPERLLPLAGLTGQQYNPTISGNRRLVYENVALDVDVVLRHLDTLDERVIAGSTLQDVHPALSLDENKLALVSDRSGYPEVWIANSDGTNLFQLTELAGPIVAFPMFSPSARKVSFTTVVDGQFHAAIGTLASRQTKVLDQVATSSIPVYWRDDRNLVVATVNDQAWRSELINLDDGRRQYLGEGIVLSINTGGRVVFDPARLRLEYVSENGLRTEIYELVEPYAWNIGPDRICFLNRESSTVYVLDLSTMATSELAVLDDAMQEQFAVSNDGTRLYFGKIRSSTSDLYWLEL